MTLRHHLTLALYLALLCMIEVSISVVCILSKNRANRSITMNSCMSVYNSLVDEWFEVEETARDNNNEVCQITIL